MSKIEKTQAEAFCDAAIGWDTLGVDSNGEEIVRPNSPVLQAFVRGHLGCLTPRHGYDAMNTPERREAFATMLREIADVMHPVQTKEAPAAASATEWMIARLPVAWMDGAASKEYLKAGWEPFGIAPYGPSWSDRELHVFLRKAVQA